MKFLSGLPETACGVGSTLAATETLRAWLPGALARFQIRTLLDAPCGDCNWITRTDLSTLTDYLGIDFLAEHIETASDHIARMERALLPLRTMSALKGDVLNDPWPRCDAVMTRDFLQHWPHSVLPGFLRRFEESGAEYLFATSFDTVENHDIRSAGGFNPLNVRRAPLNWPEPLEAVDDGEGRIVGVWSRDMLVRRAAA